MGAGVKEFDSLRCALRFGASGESLQAVATEGPWAAR